MINLASPAVLKDTRVYHLVPKNLTDANLAVEICAKKWVSDNIFNENFDCTQKGISIKASAFFLMLLCLILLFWTQKVLPEWN